MQKNLWKNTVFYIIVCFFCLGLGFFLGQFGKRNIQKEIKILKTNNTKQKQAIQQLEKNLDDRQKRVSWLEKNLQERQKIISKLKKSDKKAIQIIKELEQLLN